MSVGVVKGVLLSLCWFIYLAALRLPSIGTADNLQCQLLTLGSLFIFDPCIQLNIYRNYNCN